MARAHLGGLLPRAPLRGRGRGQGRVPLPLPPAAPVPVSCGCERATLRAACAPRRRGGRALGRVRVPRLALHGGGSSAPGHQSLAHEPDPCIGGGAGHGGYAILFLKNIAIDALGILSKQPGTSGLRGAALHHKNTCCTTPTKYKLSLWSLLSVLFSVWPVEGRGFARIPSPASPQGSQRGDIDSPRTDGHECSSRRWLRMPLPAILLCLQLLLAVREGAPSAMGGHGLGRPAGSTRLLAVRGGSFVQQSSASVYDAAAHVALLKTTRLLSDSARTNHLRSTDGLTFLAREARAGAERAYQGGAEADAAGGETDSAAMAVFKARVRRGVTMLLVPYFELYLQLLSADAVSLFNSDVNSSRVRSSSTGAYADGYASSAGEAMETATRFFDSSVSVAAAAFLGEGQSPAPTSENSAIPFGRCGVLWRMKHIYEQLKARPPVDSSGAYSGSGCSTEILASSIDLHRQRLRRAMSAFVDSREAQSRLAGALPRQPRLFPPVSLQLHWYLTRPFGARLRSY